MNQKDIYVSRGSKSILAYIFPSLCFAFAAYLVYYGFRNAEMMDPKDRIGHIIFGVMMVFLVSVLGGGFGIILLSQPKRNTNQEN